MRFVALAILALAIAGCKNKTTAHFERVAAQLPAAEAAAKKAGVPLHSREIAPPALKPEDNAAPLLAEASKLLREVRGENKQHIYFLAYPRSEAEGRNLRELLTRAEPVFRLLTKAAERKGVDFERKWDTDRPWEIPLTQYSEFKNLAQWAAIRGIIAARDGDLARAIQELDTSLQIGKFSGSEPNIISALVMCAVDILVFRQFELTVTEQNSVEFLGQLRALLEKHATRNNLWHYLRSEPVSALGIIKLLQDGKVEELAALSVEEQPKAIVPDGIPPGLAASAYQTRILQFWTKVAAQLQSQDNLLKHRAVMHEYAKQALNNPDQTYGYFKAFDPVIESFADAMLKREAARSALDGMLAALEFKARKGRFPTTLAEAGFSTPDPFTDQPLKMRMAKDSFRVWSVGNNFKDDGGEERQALDVVARYPRARSAETDKGGSK